MIAADVVLQLGAALDAGDVPRVEDLISRADASRYDDLARATVAFRKRLDLELGDRYHRGDVPGPPRFAERDAAARTAVMLTGSPQVARSGLCYTVSRDLELTRQRDRPWRQALADLLAQGGLRAGSAIGWSLVRALVLAQDVDRPAGDGYLALMVRGIGHVETDLIDDPGLRDSEVWDLFTAGRPVVTALLYSERYPPHELGWTQSLTRLAGAGYLDTVRLHDLAASSAQDTSRMPGHRRWFHRLATRLADL